MNKTELIDAVAARAKITKTAAGQAVDAVFGVVSDALSQGQDVTLIGFGTFGVTKRAARTGRSPATGQAIKIAARIAPTFRAGKGLKDAVNK